MAVIFNTTSPLPNASVGTPYSLNILATSDFNPISFNLDSGIMPPGLIFDTSGLISGTPTTAGTYFLRIRATDSISDSVVEVFQLTIDDVVSPQIQTTSLPLGDVSVAYSEFLMATGGTLPYIDWSITTGILPPGLSLDNSTGEIFGTPTTAGTYSFVVQVEDTDNRTDIQGLAITINGSAPTIDTTTLPNATTSNFYDETILASGGTLPYVNWNVVSGLLPPGLMLTGFATSAKISGTPTSPGTYPFTVRVTDNAAALDDQTYTLVVESAGVPVISTTTLDSGVNLVAYSEVISASGGVQPYTWSLSSGNLPPGLTINSTTGEISGTPTSTGSYLFTVTVTDDNGNSDSKQLAILINQTLNPNITTFSFPDSNVGQNYSSFINAVDGCLPYSWAISSGSLPTGLSLNSTTGEVSGVPTVSGGYNFDIEVTDCQSNTDSVSYSVTINPPGSLTILENSLPVGDLNVPYSKFITVIGGQPNYTYSLGGILPNGLSLDTATGEISGTPTQTGSFAITITVIDASGLTAVKNYSIIINATGLNSDCCYCVLTGEVVNFVDNSNGSGILTSTGGVVINNSQWQAPNASGIHNVTLSLETNFGLSTITHTITVIESISCIDYIPFKIIEVIETNNLVNDSLDNLINDGGDNVIEG